MHRHTRTHINKPVLVLGTGPSAWHAAKDSELTKLLNRIPTIAVNRAFNVGITVQYQISLDRIWGAFLRWEKDRLCLDRLRRLFKLWQTKHKPAADNWTLEEFVEAKDVEVTGEIESYFRLISPHAPFTRFVTEANKTGCPYDAVSFQTSRSKAVRWGVYRDGLVGTGNTALPAMHLATVMGANPILLLGVDWTAPMPKERPWERGACYQLDRAKKSMMKLATDLRGQTNVYNLSPVSWLPWFQKAKNWGETLTWLKGFVKHV